MRALVIVLVTFGIALPILAFAEDQPKVSNSGRVQGTFCPAPAIQSCPRSCATWASKAGFSGLIRRLRIELLQTVPMLTMDLRERTSLSWKKGASALPLKINFQKKGAPTCAGAP
jgi:hypothetical protein